MIYAIVTGTGFAREIDQIVEGLTIAKREKRDLEKMGWDVRLVKFETWDAAHAYESKLRGW